MKQATIRRVLIIGAGTMGQQIAWQCAAQGYDVVIYDTVAKVLDNVEHIRSQYFLEENPFGLQRKQRVFRL